MQNSIMEVVKSSQYWIRQEQIDDLEKFKAHYTYKPKFDNLSPICTLTYRKEDGVNWWGFPRNTKLVNGEEVIDQTSMGNPLPFPVEFLGELWDYQEPVLLKFVDKLHEGVNDLILSSATGSGKTVMLLKMWTMLRVPALVIVPKSDLMEQWEERIIQFTNLKKEHIGKARQDVCNYKDKAVVIGMIHSLCKDKYPVSFKHYFGAVIFDELHKLGAQTFSQVGGMFPAKYRIGATATLRRADGMSRVFYSHLGENVIKPLRGDQPTPKIVIVRYQNSSGRIPHWANTKVKRRGTLFSLLSGNRERTEWIAEYAKEVYSSGRQTLVLGERIKQLENIRTILYSGLGVDRKDIGLYIGKTSATERERIAKECRIILATTSMLSLGTDIPTLRGLVFATPLADAEQAIGRICRHARGTEYPVVIDFVDATYNDCNNWLRARLKLYQRKEWEVVYATR